MTDLELMEALLRHTDDLSTMPREFINHARYRDANGSYVEVRGNDLTDLLDDAPRWRWCRRAEIKIDIEALAMRARLDMEYVLERVQLMLLKPD